MNKSPRTVAALVALWAASAYAYNEDGHFYTVATLEAERLDLGSLPADHFGIVALCAQMPDLARELDAVTLKVNSLGSFGGWLWGGFSSCSGEGVRRMVTVHHYVHALTDSDASKVEAAARQTVTTLRSAWSRSPTYTNACALGIGLHLLGDAHSHRRIGEESRMYAPGMGHYKDDHDPDYIVFPNRLPLWKHYVGMVGEAHAIPEEKVHRGALFQITESRLTGGSRDNSFFTSQIIEDMSKLHAPPGGHPLAAFPSSVKPVEKYYAEAGWYRRHVLDRSFDEVVNDYAKDAAAAGLKFSNVWPAYLSAAREAFKSVPPPCDPT